MAKPPLARHNRFHAQDVSLGVSHWDCPMFTSNSSSHDLTMFSHMPFPDAAPKAAKGQGTVKSADTGRRKGERAGE